MFVQLALELPRFVLLRMALADDEIMGVGRPVGDGAAACKQHVLPLAQPDLPDRADQLGVGRKAKLAVQIARGRPRAELVEIDAVVEHVRFSAGSPPAT